MLFLYMVDAEDCARLDKELTYLAVSIATRQATFLNILRHTSYIKKKYIIETRDDLA